MFLMGKRTKKIANVTIAKIMIVIITIVIVARAIVGIETINLSDCRK